MSKPNPDRKQCHARSKRTGEQCSAWAVRGFAVCRMHGAGGATPEAEAHERATLQPGRHVGAPVPPPPPLGNQWARKHGGYSTQLMPNEQLRYEETCASFLRALGDEEAITDFDRRLIHQAAVACAKFDGAAEAGAPAEIIGQLNRVVLELLRELKATRASRAPKEQSAGVTIADLGRLVLEQARRRNVRGVFDDNLAGALDVTPPGRGPADVGEGGGA